MQEVGRSGEGCRGNDTFQPRDQLSGTKILPKERNTKIFYAGGVLDGEESVPGVLYTALVLCKSRDGETRPSALILRGDWRQWL